MSCTTWWPLNLRSNAQLVQVLLYSLLEVSFGLWFRVSYTYLQYNSYSCGNVRWSICIGWVIHLMLDKSCVTVTPIIAITSWILRQASSELVKAFYRFLNCFYSENWHLCFYLTWLFSNMNSFLSVWGIVYWSRYANEGNQIH